MLPSTLEWHAAVALAALAGLVWLPLLLIAAGMLGLSVLVAALQSAQANMPVDQRNLPSRLVIAGLCYAQPLARSGQRYWTRLFHPSVIVPDGDLRVRSAPGLSLTGMRTLDFWSEVPVDRTELLDDAVAYLTAHRWAKELGTGWEPWDLLIYCHPLTVVRLETVQENHGEGKNLIRVRLTMRPRAYLRVAGALAVLTAGAIAAWFGWGPGGCALVTILITAAAGWWSATRRAARVVALVQHAAGRLGLFRFTLETELGHTTQLEGAT
jgi:hypothetical protein